MYEEGILNKHIREMVEFINTIDQHKDYGLYYVANEILEMYKFMQKYTRGKK